MVGRSNPQEIEQKIEFWPSYQMVYVLDIDVKTHFICQVNCVGGMLKGSRTLEKE